MIILRHVSLGDVTSPRVRFVRIHLNENREFTTLKWEICDFRAVRAENTQKDKGRTNVRPAFSV